MRDNGSYGYAAPSTVSIVFDYNALKSADPVTYDDNGNVIPLSQRFDMSNDDIRYSRAEKQYVFDNRFDDDLKTINEGGNLGVNDIVIGQTPLVLRDIGILNKNMVIDQKHTRAALLGLNDADHTMTASTLKRIIRKMNDPIGVISSDSDPNGSVVVIVD